MTQTTTTKVFATMGVKLCPDQQLTAAVEENNPPKTRRKISPLSLVPKILCVKNLRHVAPYFVRKELPVGKLAPGKALGPALGITMERLNNNTCDESEDDVSLRKRPVQSTIVKNVALVDWWSNELFKGRLVLENVTNPLPESRSNNIVATPYHVISEGDVLVGRYHFHEQSVLEYPKPTIVYQDENFIVVNKPGGIDVLSNPDAHRVVNSLPGILAFNSSDKSSSDDDLGGLTASILQQEEAEEHSQGVMTTIIPAHRIDNPVSGLVCCGRTNKDARKLSRKIQARETTKTYLARVVSIRNNKKWNTHTILPTTDTATAGSAAAGTTFDFPSLPLDIEVPLGFDKTRGRAFVDDSSGKPSRTTLLQVLASLEDGSHVVAVRPHTGRKHQLRVHLAHVGLPIANDTIYNNGNGVFQQNDEPEISAFGLPEPPQELVELWQDHFVQDCFHCQYVRELLLQSRKESSVTTNKTIGPIVRQPIWLHSWKYEFPSLGLSFEAPIPEWAHADEWQ